MAKKTTAKKSAKVPVKKTAKAAAQPAAKKIAKKAAQKSVKKPTRRTKKTTVVAPPQDMDSYIYTQAKAKLILEKGIDGYRAIDALGMPTADLSTDDASRLLEGCRQMTAGAGRTKKKPLTKIGIFGLCAMMHTFHFSIESREKIETIDRPTEVGLLQRLVFRHDLLRSRMVVLYNEHVKQVPFCIDDRWRATPRTSPI